MDGDFRVDLGDIQKNLEGAEVISLYFPLLRKALLVDTRHDAVDGPLVKVVPMVDSIEERLRSLRRLRPRFPRPESLAVIPWPKYVSSLKRLGLWDRLVQRMAALGDVGTVRACQTAFEELCQLEREEVAAAIKGERYHSLWPRK